MSGCGVVVGARGALLQIEAPGAAIGKRVTFINEGTALAGTVRAFAGGRGLVAPHGAIDGISRGTLAVVDHRGDSLALGTCAFGRAIDAGGNALDGGPSLRGPRFAVARTAPAPETRRAVTEPLWTGVRAIDALLTLGRGARVGIFGAPGTGKSSLLETIACGVSADAVVVGLIGERGREAQEWMQRIDSRTTIVCATSDRTACERLRAAEVAVAQAEALAERGLDVLLVLDSLARYAAALREVAVSAGETPGRGGYPPSVFAWMAALVERCGSLASGSITLVATVLNDGDDRDPASEAARSLLDGHIQLSPQLAAGGRFPAIDVLHSASRTMAAVVEPDALNAARRIRSALALLAAAADARSLGIEPVDAASTSAIGAESAIEALLRQASDPAAPDETLRMAREIADTLGELHGHSK